MSRCYLAVLLFALLNPRLAWAQVTPDTTVALPEVRIEADRTRDQPATAAARLTLLGPKALGATTAWNVAEVLDARTGLVVQRYGSGGLATASLRGAGSAHTLVLLDGLRLADPQTGQVDLSLLPTLLLDGVEIVHGAAAGRYGSGALGGVVRLHTLPADGPTSFKASSSAGAFGERSVGLVTTGHLRHWSGVAALEARHAPGDFPYRDETVVPAREQRRSGADRTLATLFGRASYRARQGHLTATAWYNQAERGLPGPANAPPGKARQWDQHLRLWVDGRWRQKVGSLTARLLAQQTWLRYVNPATATDDTSRTRSLTLEAELERVTGSHWLAEGGVALGFDEADLRGGVEQTRLGAYAQGTGSYGRWLLAPALRFDLYRSQGEVTFAVSPKLGLNVQPFSGSGLRLKASVGRAFRRPTFNERFWQPGGNPDLKPERGWSIDAGILVQQRRDAYSVEAEVTSFATQLRDQIIWQPSFVDAGVQVWHPANLARVVTFGLEASANGQLKAGRFVLDGGWTFTLTDARDRSDPAAAAFGHRLRYVPTQQFKTFLGLRIGSLQFDGSARLIGPRPLTTDGSMLLEPNQVLGAQLRYNHDFGPVAATLALAVENLLDANYTVVRFYPMPPRHARLRLILDLHP